MAFAVSEIAHPVIVLLRRCSPKTYKALVTDGKFASVIVKLLREVAHNYLTNKGRLPITSQQRNRLSRQKDLLIALSECTTSITRLTKLIVKNQRAIAGAILEPLEMSL